MKIHALVPQLSVIFIFLEAVNVLLTTSNLLTIFSSSLSLVGVRRVSNLYFIHRGH